MPTHLVNLDALFKREDFEAKSDPLQQPSQLGLTLKVSELESTSLTYLTLRKPDFQRETASWEPQIVADLIRCFLDGDLIPSIILWRSTDTGNIFVIDGAHRLGALIAWVHDDFGDGKISRVFFENRMPTEQLAAATKTRDLIKKEVGTYEELNQALKNPANSSESMVRRARNLSAFAVPLQWVIGDATKAEASFFKINQLAAPINETELRILESRNRPNALAARAIIRAGTGHKYWSKFEDDKRTEIEKIAREINTSLFTPPLQTPVKTLDLPIAGRVYSAQALPLLFDLVNIANDVPPEKKKRGKKKAAEVTLKKVDPAADTDGTRTIECLKNTKRLIYRISSGYSSSLGLHPAVYFYSATGRHQPTSFLAAVNLMKEFERKDYFATFTAHRRRFEDFLIKYKDFPNQVVVNSGSGIKGYAKLEQLFAEILKQIENGKDEAGVIDALSADERFKFLRVTEPTLATKRKGFNTDVKSAAFLKDALPEAVRCSMCNCHIHPNAMTVDHAENRRDGGTGSLANAQLAHPYCNSTYKDLKAQAATKD
jgi:hypothetical protein